MDKPKYLAEGFEDDAAKLLNEFAETGSIEFSKFAEVWKRNHFSLIFMGRPDQVESSEFTNEVYRISVHFLSSSSVVQRIGAVYLLYALYRNQIADPPIKIRIEIGQRKIIKTLHSEAILKKYKTLHYVIDYLIKNSFVYVANQTLKGPLIGSMQKMSKSSEIISNMKPLYKSDIIEYSMVNNLQALRDLHVQYLEVKKNFDGQVKVSLNADSEAYDSFISELDKLMNPPSQKETESLGSRRAKIKARSFIREVNNRFGQFIDDPDAEVNEDIDLQEEVVKKRVKNRRVPKHERKVGRPSKKSKKVEVEAPAETRSDDDNIDISHLIHQQHDFYLPPDEDGRKLKCKPGRYYYKLSPKREGGSSSD